MGDLYQVSDSYQPDHCYYGPLGSETQMEPLLLSLSLSHSLCLSNKTLSLRKEAILADCYLSFVKWHSDHSERLSLVLGFTILLTHPVYRDLITKGFWNSLHSDSLTL